jgi:hypothetical protein
MRKHIFLYLLPFTVINANAAVEWWLKPTICQPSSVECYVGMGTGFDAELWDVGGNCRGEKLICPNAVVSLSESSPMPFSKSEISNSSIISGDFDVSALNSQQGCFGLRKTRNNGTNAKVGNEWRNVYCSGILDYPDEILQTGEIMLGTDDQPTCKSLAENGYIAILNGQCFGKFGYPSTDFYLECNDTDLLPKKIIVLNGATDIRTSTLTNPDASEYPTSDDVAKALFDRMVENATAARRAKTEVTAQ